MAEVVGAYNWGAGNVDKAIQQYGANWQLAAPQETQNYINKVLGGVGKAVASRGAGSNGVKIEIHNNTGGSAVITTSSILA